MRFLRQFQASLFFYEKILSVQKRKSNQTNQQNHKEVNKKQQKQQFFTHKNF